MTSVVCYSCKRSTVISNEQGMYCHLCDRIFYHNGTHSLSEGRTNVKINNKKTHFKKLLTSMGMLYVPYEYIQQFKHLLSSRNIKLDDVDINLVKWFLNTYNVKSTIVSFIMLNIIKNDKPSLTNSELEKSCDTFNEFIIFVHNLYPNFTVRYDFFIDKVLAYHNIDMSFKQRSYKDVTRKNIYQIIWDRFLIYFSERLKRSQKIYLPVNETVETPEEIIVD
jgi:hypothetical protein